MCACVCLTAAPRVGSDTWLASVARVLSATTLQLAGLPPQPPGTRAAFTQHKLPFTVCHAPLARHLPDIACVSLPAGGAVGRRG